MESRTKHELRAASAETFLFGSMRDVRIALQHIRADLRPERRLQLAERKPDLTERARQLGAMATALMPQGLLLATIDPEVRKARREIGAQTNAFVRSAANTVSFHAADHLQAATDALFDRRHVSLRQRYDAQLARQRRLNDEMAKKAPLATMLGQAGGTVAGALLVAPEHLAARAAPRIAGAAGLTTREIAAMLGAGGAANAGMQIATDVVTGRAPNAKDTGAAAIGGVIGAAALPFVGPARASAVTGWTTSATQDLLNGRPISAEAAGQSAIGGAVFGNLGAKAGMNRVNNLPVKAKGRLGEQLGEARSRINGEGDTVGPKTRDYIEDTQKYWYPDRTSGEVRYEDKFGYRADLTPNQRLARAALDKNFRLNHFLCEDIASLVGFPAGLAGGQVVDEALRLPGNIADIIAANRAKRSNTP